MLDIRERLKGGSTWKSFIALLLITAWVLCVWYKCGIFFETNDDRMLVEILSGVVTGKPDGYAVYMHYLLAKPLSIMYAVCPQIPWYGLFLVASYSMVLWAVVSAVLGETTEIRDLVAGGLCGSVFLLSTLQMFSICTFTTCAAFLAIGGYAYLFAKRDGKSRYIVFAVFEALAMFLREDAMLMIQPLGLGVWCGILLGTEKCSIKKKLEKACRVVLAVLAVVVTCIAVTTVAYRDAGWKDYNMFNDAEEVLFDFYGAPPYSEVKSILDKYDVTENEYNAYVNYVILDYDITPQCARELAEYVKRENGRPFDAGAICSEIAEQRFHGNYRGLNTLSTVIWCVVIAWIIVQRSRSLLWSAAGLAASEAAIWFFLFWRGRTPARVIVPLFICDIFILMILLWRDYRDKGLAKGWKYIFGIGVCLITFRYAYLTGQAQYRYIVQENRANEILAESMHEIDAYCRSNPDRRYLLGANTMCYFKGSALDARLSETKNGIVTGCWFSNSPPIRSYLKNYFENQKEIYLIVYDEQPIDKAAIDYLEEKTEAPSVKVDSFTTCSGAVYAVYYFENE